MAVENKKSSMKITKVSLVIYFSVVLVALVAFSITAWKFNDARILYGFAVCLAPGILFALISICLPIQAFFSVKTKKIIFIYSILYVLKYLALFIVPIFALLYAEESYFNRWSMLATTLLTPITIIVMKLIIAIVDSKKPQKETKTTTNSIKF